MQKKNKDVGKGRKTQIVPIRAEKAQKKEGEGQSLWPNADELHVRGKCQKRRGGEKMK